LRYLEQAAGRPVVGGRRGRLARLGRLRHKPQENVRKRPDEHERGDDKTNDHGLILERVAPAFCRLTIHMLMVYVAMQAVISSGLK
jgi:hypothetical protein